VNGTATSMPGEIYILTDIIIHLMNDLMMDKITNIEKILMEINSKIDNFLGVEDLSEREAKKVREIREEIKKGEYVKYDEINWD